MATACVELERLGLTAEQLEQNLAEDIELCWNLAAEEAYERDWDEALAYERAWNEALYENEWLWQPAWVKAVINSPDFRLCTYECLEAEKRRKKSKSKRAA
jgi:hypothetical protein